MPYIFSNDTSQALRRFMITWAGVGQAGDMMHQLENDYNLGERSTGNLFDAIADSNSALSTAVLRHDRAASLRAIIPLIERPMSNQADLDNFTGVVRRVVDMCHNPQQIVGAITGWRNKLYVNPSPQELKEQEAIADFNAIRVEKFGADPLNPFAPDPVRDLATARVISGEIKMAYRTSSLTHRGQALAQQQQQVQQQQVQQQQVQQQAPSPAAVAYKDQHMARAQADLTLFIQAIKTAVVASRNVDMGGTVYSEARFIAEDQQRKVLDQVAGYTFSSQALFVLTDLAGLNPQEVQAVEQNVNNLSLHLNGGDVPGPARPQNLPPHNTNPLNGTREEHNLLKNTIKIALPDIVEQERSRIQEKEKTDLKAARETGIVPLTADAGKAGVLSKEIVKTKTKVNEAEKNVSKKRKTGAKIGFAVGFVLGLGLAPVTGGASVVFFAVLGGALGGAAVGHYKGKKNVNKENKNLTALEQELGRTDRLVGQEKGHVERIDTMKGSLGLTPSEIPAAAIESNRRLGAEGTVDITRRGHVSVTITR